MPSSTINSISSLNYTRGCHSEGTLNEYHWPPLISKPATLAIRESPVITGAVTHRRISSQEDRVRLR